MGAILDIVVGGAPQMEDAIARSVEEAGRLALDGRGAFTLALAGGSIADFFPRLARIPLDWTRANFFWADERGVPPDDPESNYRVAHALWLEPAGVPPARIHRMHAEDPDLRRAAAAYETELTAIAGTPPVLDIALLGVGPDGHVASVFPGRPHVEHADRFVVAVDDAPKPPARRLTLTLAALAGARRIDVIARGGSKAEAIEASLKPGSDTPLAHLIRLAPNVRLLLDNAAAGLLPENRKGRVEP